MNTTLYKDKLNNKNLLNQYGLVIQTGTESLLIFPERKTYLTNSWREKHGSERDLSMPKFEDKEVTLSCAFMADNDSDFWTNYNDFFTEITKAGWQSLYIDDHSKTYNVAYVTTNDFKKTSKRLKNVSKVFVTFKLTVIIENDLPN